MPSTVGTRPPAGSWSAAGSLSRDLDLRRLSDSESVERALRVSDEARCRDRRDQRQLSPGGSIRDVPLIAKDDDDCGYRQYIDAEVGVIIRRSTLVDQKSGSKVLG
jgi:hypothetical protein